MARHKVAPEAVLSAHGPLKVYLLTGPFVLQSSKAQGFKRSVNEKSIIGKFRYCEAYTINTDAVAFFDGGRRQGRFERNLPPACHLIDIGNDANIFNDSCEHNLLCRYYL